MNSYDYKKFQEAIHVEVIKNSKRKGFNLNNIEFQKKAKSYR